MANNSPTLVMASLSDDQLKKSIDSLVTHVDEAMKKMVQSTNNAVGEMEAKLKSLGNLKIDSGGSADGGASKRAKAQNVETEAVEKSIAARDKQIKKNQEVKMSYDQMQTAIEKATRFPSEMRMDSPKSARESFYVFQGTLTTRARELTSEIKSAEAAFNSALDIKLQAKQFEWQQKLEHTQQKLAQFRASMGTNPSVQQMREEQRILNLMEQQQAMLDKIRGQRTQMLQPLMELQKEEQKVVSTMYDIFQGQKQSEQATQQTAQSAQRHTIEIEKENRALQEQKEHLEMIKEVAAQAKKDIGRYGFANIQNYRGIVYAENDERAKGLTIEQQIEKIIQEENAARNAQLGTERQITQEVEKRGKKYDSPNAEINTAFNRMVANKIGLSEQDINTTSTNISTLTQYIKQLEQAWSKMTDAEKNSPFGKQLRQELQYTTRLVQQTRVELTRPINLKDALSGSEKTLDDIAYKIQRLQSYKRGIDITNPKSTAEIKDVDREIVRLTKDLNKYMQISKEATEVNGALGRSWNYMKNRLAFYFTVSAATSFTKQLVDIRGQYEMLERSIGILIDSAQNGSRIFAELNSMAIKSPFTTMELGAAAKQLVAYDVAAKDVVDTTRRLADMAAAVGIPIERLTYALGQIKAYGYLNARDARMFANAGIPLVKELADYYTELEGRLVSTSDVYDRIKKKAISYNDVIEVTDKMTDEGGKFFNFQEKAADTLKVRLANLSLAWNNMLNEIGKDNQGVLTSGLVTLKDIFEQWRSIFNLISAVVTNIGLAKAGQLIFYLATLKSAKGMGLLLAATEKTFGVKIASRIANIVHLLGSLLTPSKLLVGAIMGLGIALTKLYFDYKDIQDANENLNESIIKNAEENISSIDKFFKEYSKQLRNIDTAPLSDQNKMWERLQEEIEKTSHNAEAFIRKLNDIGDTSERIRAGENVLDTIKNIQNEASRLAGQGLFEIGGGFADDDLSKDIKELDEVSKKLNEFKKQIDAGHTELKAFVGDAPFVYMNALKEAEKELDNFSDKFYNANLGAVMGLGDDKLERLREFTSIVRDNFLATEQGSKISADGIARINASIDKWIGRMAYLSGLQSKQESEVEANRTAWEEFFRHVDRQDRGHLDFLIKNNQTGSDEFKKIWDDAAKNMLDSASTSYDAIKDQIAALRDTPDIVIKVVYQEESDNLNDRQKRFVERWIEPDSHIVDWESYSKERKKNENMYARFNFKENESDVEHEKRLGQEYQENTKNIKSLNEQLEKGIELSKEDRAEKERQRDEMVVANMAIKNIGKYEGYNYDQFKKGGKGSKKDPVLEALKQEISLVEKLQGDYDKLVKSSASQADALSTIRGAYGKTVQLLNDKLNTYGLPQIDIAKLVTGKDPHKALEHFKQTLDGLVSKGLLTFERAKELEAVIEKLTLSAKTYDLDMITKGLNNELGKLKDEYELAVELDANPELGGMFLDMFGIDTTDFPKTIDEYMSRAQQEFDKMRKKRNFSAPLNIFKAGDKEWEEWGKQVGLVVYVLDENGNVIDKNTDALDKLTPKFKEAKGVAKKWAQDTIKATQDLQYKLADNNGKIAIEEEKLAVLRQRLAQETNDKQKTLLKLQIQDQQNAINKLKEEILQLLPIYNRLFGEVAEHSSAMTRKLARDYKNMLLDAQKRGKNPDGTYTIIDPINGKRASVTEERLGKEIKNANKELSKTDNVFKKIKESLTKGEDEIIDWVGGIENIGEAIGQIGDLVDTIGNVYDMFGNPNEYNEISESLHDVATTMQGINTAAKGIGQIAAGDYIGGAMSIISGVSSAIGAWFDNSDKKIQQSIKDSELEVSRLELAYVGLEHAIDQAYGMATIGAQKAAIANKQLQLIELKRQLELERSRDSKHRDEERIIGLQKSVKELEYDIKESTDAIVNDLLGISSVGDALESLMTNIIESFRQGSYKLKDIMKDVKLSINDMIANMVMKMYTTKILQPWFEEQWDKIQKDIDARAGDIPDKIGSAKNADLNDDVSLIKALRALGFSDEQLSHLYRFDEFGNEDQDGRNKRLRDAYEKAMKEAEKELANATIPTTDDIKRYAELLRSGQPIIEDNLKGIEDFLRELGLLNDKKTTTLSALQQGIQGITEDTAGALEAYMNGVSQQVYLHSDLLTQIRDAVVGFDVDVQVATVGQILLQLQSSYQVHMAIRDTLQSWSNASGMAVRVEMI